MRSHHHHCLGRPNICRGPAYRADLVVIDVNAMTTRDGHASIDNPSVILVVKLVTSHLSVKEVVIFVVKLVTSHLSVKEVQHRKLLTVEVEGRAEKQMW